MPTIAVVGAGGFAREVKWLLDDMSSFTRAHPDAKRPGCEDWTFAGFLADRRGQYDSPIAGDFNWLRDNPVDALALGVGDPGTRWTLGLRLMEEFPHIKWPALVHPSVQFADSCHFADGIIVCANTVATVNVRFERFSMVNLSCTIGHESIVGEASVINPLCAISGGVVLGQRVLVGTHASILQYVTVGDDAVVGSGAMVNRSVASGQTVVGVPARERSKN